MRVGGFLVSAALGLAAADATKQPPHILHVIVDDFGWGNANYNRDVPSPEVQTPNMDKLVAQGVHLMRHYVHAMCTPTRVSFLTGRLPMHSGQPKLCVPSGKDCGAPYNHTGIAEKLASAGYRTALVGKWDAGMATPTHTPKGRGYQSSLTYFGHANYQWGQIEWGQGGGGRTTEPDPHNPQWIRDLWDHDRPAVALANRSRDEGIFEESLFRERITTILDEHDPATPLFLTYAARIAHYPIQAPIEYQQLPHIAAIDVPHRRVYHAMIAFLDDQLGNITGLFKAKGMWDNTLMVLSTDNGGYVKELGPCSESDPVRGITCMTGEAGANNYPLRGGKYSFFEGGIRGNSFVSGGYLPKSVRGTKLHSLMHITDWYATYCGLAGIDPADKAGEAAGVPPVESLDVWPMISGKNLTSPRQEIFMNKNCLIDGDWKLITGKMQGASWSGPTYPNVSTAGNAVNGYTENCNPACLFNVGQHGDMTEHQDLASVHPDRVQSMLTRLAELNNGRWTNKSTPYAPTCQNLTTLIHSEYEGFYGPFCDLGPAPAPTPTPPVGWTDLGAGCCNNYDADKAKAIFKGRVATLEECKDKCASRADCGFAIHGWKNGTGTYCVAWPAASGCSALDAGGKGHCGSRGDDGVHSYAIVRETYTSLDSFLV